jgi:oligopeptidase B
MPNHPPQARRHVTSLTTHGDTRSDEYAWLREKENPETLSYLEAENAWTEQSFAHLSSLREELFGEIKGRIVETDMSVPVRRGPYWYYSRTVEGLDYQIFCRRPFQDEPTPPLILEGHVGEEILFDENEDAEGHEFFSPGIVSVSPNHAVLALGIDIIGDERHHLSFRCLDGTANPQEVIENVSYGFSWSSDSTTVFYTRVDESWRPYQLWRHRIGSDPTGDVLVYEEPDARFNIGLGRTRDEQVIIVTSSSSTTTETSYLLADEPTGDLTLLCPRIPGVEHSVEHLTTRTGSTWWLKLTNADGAEDFRLDASAHRDEEPVWSTVIAHRPSLRLEGIDTFSSFFVLSEREHAETQLRIIPFTDDQQFSGGDLSETGWTLKADTQPQTTWIGQNAENDTEVLRVCQGSLVMPHTVLQVSLATQEQTILKQQEVLGGYRTEDYVTYRSWAAAADGALIPISIVHHRRLLADGAAPGDRLLAPAACLLYGYGSYEISIDPSFSTSRLSLLDRNVVFAIAHVRGGGELGRAWYDQGHLEAKENSFSDFIAVADHLVDIGLTTPDQLAARGGSAGGLLVGAVANQGPDRFCALLAEVPFVDALNSMLDPTLPLTVGEYEEWGNPTDDEAAYNTIKSYAPYENIKMTQSDGSPFCYPPMLLTAGLNDTRVGYWEPAKFVARLRFANPDNPVFLRTEMAVGHGGPSGRYEAWREEAFVLAWLLERLNAITPARQP